MRGATHATHLTPSLPPILQFGFVMVVPEAGAASGECGTCPGGVLANLNCRAWNATPACCSPASASASTSVDDGAYLESVITAVSSKFTIDSNRVYVAGLDAGCVPASCACFQQ